MTTESTETDDEVGAIVPGKTAPASGGGRDLLPPGKYLTAIKHVERTLAPKGKARLSWQFAVAAGPHKGRVIFDDTYLTQAAIWKVQTLAACAGLAKEQQFNPKDAAQLIDLFVGKELFITTAEDPYKNKDGLDVVGRKVVAYDSADAKIAQEMAAERAARTAGSTGDAPAEGSADDKEIEGDIPF